MPLGAGAGGVSFGALEVAAPAPSVGAARQVSAAWRSPLRRAFSGDVFCNLRRSGGHRLRFFAQSHDALDGFLQ